jgi:integrase/recombinase XerD
MVKRTANAAEINTSVSPRWLRHAHGSHTIERGVSSPDVQATLGHAISRRRGYLHDRADSSSGLRPDPGAGLEDQAEWIRRKAIEYRR